MRDHCNKIQNPQLTIHHEGSLSQGITAPPLLQTSKFQTIINYTAWPLLVLGGLIWYLQPFPDRQKPTAYLSPQEIRNISTISYNFSTKINWSPQSTGLLLGPTRQVHLAILLHDIPHNTGQFDEACQGNFLHNHFFSSNNFSFRWMLDLANWISSDCKQRQFQRENRLISGFVSKPKLYNTKTVKDAAKLGGEELAHARTQILGALWEGPYQLLSPTFGHCPLGRGCLNACPDGLGHLFREELSKFKWVSPCFFGGWGV